MRESTLEDMAASFKKQLAYDGVRISFSHLQWQIAGFVNGYPKTNKFIQELGAPTVVERLERIIRQGWQERRKQTLTAKRRRREAELRSPCLPFIENRSGS